MLVKKKQYLKTVFLSSRNVTGNVKKTTWRIWVTVWVNPLRSNIPISLEKTKAFPLINSHFPVFRLCIDILRRKLMLVTQGT